MIAVKVIFPKTGEIGVYPLDAVKVSGTGKLMAARTLAGLTACLFIEYVFIESLKE